MKQEPSSTIDINLDRKLAPGISVAAVLLLAVMLLSLGLHLYNIGSIHDANAYYTAAVKSMLQSWKNFFFIAAEPGGSVTVDKPPLGLWIEAGFAYLLGLSGFSVSLPNILAGVLSVPLLYSLVKRHSGKLAGLIAALVMTITPVFVATNRNNTQDGLLTFVLLVAAWAFVQAVETGQSRWLMLGALIVGLGFNIKMMQAFLPLPAFYALYFFGSRLGWLRKTFSLGAATLILLLVSLSWALVVDSIPADQRPFIGSSDDNTVMSLIFGHNGISRLENIRSGIGGLGLNQPGPGGRPAAGPQAANPQAGQNGRQQPPAEALSACQSSTFGAECSFTLPGGQNINGICINAPNTIDLVCAPQAGAAGRPGGPAVTDRPGLNGQNPGGTPFSQETGTPGILRFFVSPLSRQMSWLLPFALISMLLALFAAPLELPHIRADVHKALLVWGGWLLTCVVFLSMISGIFHAYYVIMLAPPLGAMTGIGVEQFWRWGGQKKWAAAALFACAALTIAFQYIAAAQYGENSAWLWGAGVLLGLGGILIFVRPRLAYPALVAGMLVIPFYWTVMTAAGSPDVNLPAAYPGRGQQQPGNPQPIGGRKGIDNRLVEYLQINTRDVKYLAAVPSSNQLGAQLVLASGRPVLYMGGFGGGDKVVNAADLMALVANSELRYIYYSPNSQDEISIWLKNSCTLATELNKLDAAAPPQPVQGPGGQAAAWYVCR